MIKVVFKYFIRWFHLVFSTFKKKQAITIIVKTDNIGDYVLFRNFLPFLRQSTYCKNHKVILLGNITWKGLATHYDMKHVDEFIWVDVKKINSNQLYKKTFLQKIELLNVHNIINMVHSRTFLIDEIVYHSGAKNRITTQGDATNIKRKTYNLSQFLLYNKIIKILDNTHFEFYRNRSLVENLTGVTIQISKPFFEYNISKTPNLIGIFPGASGARRRWKSQYFGNVIQLMNESNPNLKFKIFGAASDNIIANEIIATLPNTVNCTNSCGQTTIPELITNISKLSLLITNETVAGHIAVAVDTTTVCIANGVHFGRFSPYPKEITSCIHTIYPNMEFDKNQNNQNFKKQFFFISPFNINEIQPADVFTFINEIIK